MALPKIIMVSEEVAALSWNKHLPVPLQPKEKVIVDANQDGVAEGYVRIRHGETKVKSVFNISHFRHLNGKSLKDGGKE